MNKELVKLGIIKQLKERDPVILMMLRNENKKVSVNLNPYRKITRYYSKDLNLLMKFNRINNNQEEPDFKVSFEEPTLIDQEFNKSLLKMDLMSKSFQSHYRERIYFDRNFMCFTINEVSLGFDNKNYRFVITESIHPHKLLLDLNTGLFTTSLENVNLKIDKWMKQFEVGQFYYQYTLDDLLEQFLVKKIKRQENKMKNSDTCEPELRCLNQVYALLRTLTESSITPNMIMFLKRYLNKVYL